jgi:hypothetical protein
VPTSGKSARHWVDGLLYVISDMLKQCKIARVALSNFPLRFYFQRLDVKERHNRCKKSLQIMRSATLIQAWLYSCFIKTESAFFKRAPASAIQLKAREKLPMGKSDEEKPIMDTPTLPFSRMTGRSWAAVVVLLVSLEAAMSCSGAADRVLPPVEVTSDGSADDHRSAAALYQQEAQRLEAQAQKYADEAAAIKPLEDTKGFRRNALIRTAQNFREKAREMQQLYVSHVRKAETMTGMQPRQ